MKLLLTSTGLVNAPIRQALISMLPATPSELTVAVIPTAKNRNSNDKRVFLRILQSLDQIGFGKIDWVDVASITKEYWLPRLTAADVIYVCGGNTYYLLSELRRSGLGAELPRLLESRVYVGDSAGAIVVTPSIDIASVDDGDEDIVGLTNTRGLHLVDFEVSPHTPEDVSIAGNSRYAATIQHTLYAFDDNTALQFTGENVTFVGTGEHQVFNERLVA